MMSTNPEKMLSFFNEEYYLLENTDVADAVKKGIFSSARQHFIQHGAKEGRKPSADFDNQPQQIKDSLIETENTADSNRGNLVNFSQNFGWVGEGNNLLDTQNLQTHIPTCQCMGCASLAVNDNPLPIAQGLVIGQANPLSSLPHLSSNPNATAKIYLDFDGHVTTGTSWNSYKGIANIVTPAYSIDGDTTTFSNDELATIEEIWKRVAEDYAPFNVDVTTVDPGNLSAPNNIRVAIGGSWRDWYGSSAGGVAFLNSWQSTTDTPVFAFEENLANGYAKYTAEAITHEVGHSLGLYHQSSYDSAGNKTAEYNQGSNGWAPIMGVSYYQELTTWHNGPNSNGSTSYQDDMALITQPANGFGYRTDDRGNTNATATPLSGNTTLSSSGIISTTSDIDVFSFTTGAGQIDLNVNVAEYSPNLDVVAELRNSNNILVASSNPSDLLNANISTSVAAGTYYLHVKSNGEYGRVGQYTVNGTIQSTTTIEGTPGNDNLVGTANSEIINGYAGDDTLGGKEGNDTLNGGDGKDILNGGAGDDSLIGSAGNDTYYIDSAADVIAGEVAGGGIDRVNSTISYTLAAELENLTLQGTEPINGTGNSLNNVITGNQANNVLNGEVGDDNLRGGAGNDTLNGGDDNDTLRGEAGDDMMAGGAGDDTYYIDSIGDAIVGEVAGGGLDRVNSTVSYTLAAELENLTLQGTEPINGTGNSLNNVITGNEGNNILSSDAGDDNLRGNGGNDSLIGGAGNDSLTGGGGSDRFVFNTDSPFTTAALGVDRINDFVTGSGGDRIVLSKQTFSALTSAVGDGFSAFNEFATVTTDVAAAISEARIVYNSSNGRIFYNQDGTAAGFGEGALFASLSNKPIITASDFTLI